MLVGKNGGRRVMVGRESEWEERERGESLREKNELFCFFYYIKMKKKIKNF